MDITKGVTDLLKLIGCFLYTPLAMDKQTPPAGAIIFTLIGVRALFRIFFWVMGLSTVMGLRMVADFSGNNTIININAINLNAIVVHHLL